MKRACALCLALVWAITILVLNSGVLSNVAPGITAVIQTYMRALR